MQDAATMQLSANIFDKFAQLAKKESGLILSPEKILMIQSRLRQRLNAHGIDSFEKYFDFVSSQSGAQELRMMISVLTTNVSHFFREDHHFEILTERCSTHIRKKISNGQRIRFWSAGCSTGQEPVSLALHLLNTIPEIKDADFKILASDIDPKVLDKAEAGVYSDKEMQSIPESFRKYFEEIQQRGSSCWSVSERIKSFIVFKELNLLKNWPMKFPFDAIFCRNVVIYFDAETQNALWPRFVNYLDDHGILFLGHSERISDPEEHGLDVVGPTSYCKV